MKFNELDRLAGKLPGRISFLTLAPKAVILAAFWWTMLFAVVTQSRGRNAPDYSSQEVPLYEQVTRRIQEKVSSRLGEKRNLRDRYFIIPFAYENKENDPEFSHSFITVIRVFPDNRQTGRTPELKLRAYRQREFEAFTISWLPQDFLKDPTLCVFAGFGARLFPSMNQCAISVGRSFTLRDTLHLAAKARVSVGMWGPYEITRGGFDLAVKRMRLLNAGHIKYRADDRLTRKTMVAINCFHAMQGLDELFPAGGFLGTGFKMWGLNGTTRALLEYTTKASNKGLLLEPVDVKKDRYGFVFTPDGESAPVHNPFANASVYRK